MRSQKCQTCTVPQSSLPPGIPCLRPVTIEALGGTLAESKSTSAVDVSASGRSGEKPGSCSGRQQLLSPTDTHRHPSALESWFGAKIFMKYNKADAAAADDDDGNEHEMTALVPGMPHTGNGIQQRMRRSVRGVSAWAQHPRMAK